MDQEIYNPDSRNITDDMLEVPDEGFGFMPFDLKAPARILYPVFTPYRDRSERRLEIGDGVYIKRTFVHEDLIPDYNYTLHFERDGKCNVFSLEPGQVREFFARPD